MHSSEWDGPLTASDLRSAAEALDEIEATTLGANRAIGRIESVIDDSLIGHYTRFDDDPDGTLGWGFTQLVRAS